MSRWTVCICAFSFVAFHCNTQKLVVAPVAMNFEYTTPLTSQKAVSMTLQAEGALLNFFAAGELCNGPLTVLCFQAQNDAPNFCCQWQCCTVICRHNVSVVTTNVSRCPSISISVPQHLANPLHSHFWYLKSAIITCTYLCETAFLFAVAC
jgi:hypothetical protein